MDESTFDRLADETLVAIEEAIDESGADIDYDSAGGILTLEFENGSQIIINKQAPLTQIWVAARSGGFHFDYDDDAACWRLQGSGEELFACLGRYCSEQAGEAVELLP
ncbi:MAG: iron donor protein CyaY [Gammaproteobacteria bacterium]|nr:iron donor protein CyaY [Gammaproteobacteria bacterium]